MTSGDLPIDFRWFFDGRPVKEFAGITTVKLGNRNSVLNIDSVTGQHAGNYTCQASNSADSLNYTAELAVKGILKLECVVIVALGRLTQKFVFCLLV